MTLAPLGKMSTWDIYKILNSSHIEYNNTDRILIVGVSLQFASVLVKWEYTKCMFKFFFNAHL